jgi:hypothetical protein
MQMRCFSSQLRILHRFCAVKVIEIRPDYGEFTVAAICIKQPRVGAEILKTVEVQRPSLLNNQASLLSHKCTTHVLIGLFPPQTPKDIQIAQLDKLQKAVYSVKNG